MYLPEHKDECITPIWIERAPSTPDYLLKWTYHGSYLTPVFKVFVNGVVYGSTTNNYLPVSNLKAGKSYRFDVLALSRMQDLLDFTGYIYVPAKGSRLKLTIPQASLITNPKFYSYLVYMSDDGTDPTELETELVGINNTTYITRELEDGKQYKFRIKLNKFTGKTSDYGPVISGSVNTLPESPTPNAVSYNQATRQATLTAVKPSKQDADVMAYYLYSNHLAGYGLQSQINFLYPLAVFTPGQTLSYVTKELSSGHHKWCFVGVDGSGLMSDFQPMELFLVQNGQNLIQSLQPPMKPYYIDAIPIADGMIKVTVKIDDPKNATHINIYRDGVLDGTVTTTTKKAYEYTTGTLTHNQTYSFSASAANDTSESDLSDAVTATADNEAPTGNMSLTLELID